MPGPFQDLVRSLLERHVKAAVRELERQFSAAFHTDSAQLRIADTEVARAEANLDAARVLMPGLIAAIVTYTAARFALDQQVTIGQMIAFYGFAVFLTLPLNDIMAGANMLTAALVSAGRITTLLNTEAPDRTRVEVTTENRGAGHLADPTSGLEVPPATLMAVACAESPFAEVLAYVVDGRVAATGTHHELLATDPGYQGLIRRDDALEVGR
jgi:ABC-type multidrug transport system fused ATPase/permease subunit